MNALNIAEAGIPEEVLSGWRSEYGHKAEENFETALGKLGVETVQGDPDSRKSFPAALPLKKISKRELISIFLIL